MALIEHPLLAVKIRDVLRQEGIPFLFETRLDENVMAVRVVGQVMEREGVLRERAAGSRRHPASGLSIPTH